MNKHFFVTTPIFYPTGEPHIGTAYNVFIADTLARYYRQQGVKTQFLTGTDEHGANIAKKAEEQGKTPQDYVDGEAAVFKNLWADLGISNDYFIQTTDPRHEKFAAELLQKSYDNGDIYEGSYSGLYCQSCEAYYTESDLVDGKCPNHPTKEPVWTEEKNYYFKWSKYQDWLLQFYEENPEFVVPEKWFNYAKDFVKKGLQDIPVTRANVQWGIKVPFDPAQTIYVWYDALPNYYSYLTNILDESDAVENYWPNVTHVVGKDIIKFHAILWPAMLKSAGYQPPKQILTHGFFTINGQKIGKSNNNAISPREFIQTYGIDTLRFTLLSEFQVGQDGDFNLDRLGVRYNELGNNWGNLLNRVIHLATAKGIQLNEADEVDTVVSGKIAKTEEAYHELFTQRKLFEAIQEVNELVAFGNKYIDDHKPWEKERSEVEVRTTLLSLAKLLEKVNELYAPILPEKTDLAKNALNKQEKIILFPKFE